MLASCFANSMFANSTTLLAGFVLVLFLIVSLTSDLWTTFASRAAYVLVLMIARPFPTADLDLSTPPLLDL